MGALTRAALLSGGAHSSQSCGNLSVQFPRPSASSPTGERKACRTIAVTNTVTSSSLSPFLSLSLFDKHLSSFLVFNSLPGAPGLKVRAALSSVQISPNCLR